MVSNIRLIKRDQTLKIKVLKNKTVPKSIAAKPRMLFHRTRNTCDGVVTDQAFDFHAVHS